MQNKNLKVVTKVIAGVAFAALFVVNATAFVQKSGKTSSNLSLTGLMASASADSEGGVTGKGTVCGSDECSITLGVGGTNVTAYGHYNHCKISTASNTCSSSDCLTKCDAVIKVF